MANQQFQLDQPGFEIPEAKPVDVQPATPPQQQFGQGAGWMGKAGVGAAIGASILEGWMAGERIKEQRMQQQAQNKLSGARQMYAMSVQNWQQWRSLIDCTNFIVISRPGFDLARVETVLPLEWKRRGTPRDRRGIEYRLRRTSVYVISDVWVPVSATDIRAALSPDGRGRADRSVPGAVAEYLRKTGLYADVANSTS